MQQVPTTRAAHVIGFCEILRRIGAPVQQYLAASHLPENLEETRDDYVNYILGTAFIGMSSRREGIPDIGWLWAREFSESKLCATLTDALRIQPTVLRRLRQLFYLAHIEDSHIRLELTCLGPTVQVICDMDVPTQYPGMAAASWTHVVGVIAVIRSATHPDWTPQAITFQAEFEVCAEAQESFPNTRIVTGAPNTSVVFSRDVLAMRSSKSDSAPPVIQDAVASPDDLEVMRSLIRPYLRGPAPRISVAAEIFGMSIRTLQRRLQNLGMTYSELIDTTRFEIAADLLCSTDARIIDIAATLGFDDQSNFSRSFRRHAGMSPGRFRRANVETYNAPR